MLNILHTRAFQNSFSKAVWAAARSNCLQTFCWNPNSIDYIEPSIYCHTTSHWLNLYSQITDGTVLARLTVHIKVLIRRTRHAVALLVGADVIVRTAVRCRNQIPIVHTTAHVRRRRSLLAAVGTVRVHRVHASLTLLVEPIAVGTNGRCSYLTVAGKVFVAESVMKHPEAVLYVTANLRSWWGWIRWRSSGTTLRLGRINAGLGFVVEPESIPADHREGIAVHAHRETVTVAGILDKAKVWLVGAWIWWWRRWRRRWWFQVAFELVAVSTALSFLLEDLSFVKPEFFSLWT